MLVPTCLIFVVSCPPCTYIEPASAHTYKLNTPLLPLLPATLPPAVCCCSILFSLLFALITAGILSIFWHSKVVNIAISGIGAAVFACYIVFDVQLMMGGGAYSIEPDEYVFAAINIYLVSLG